MNINSLFEFIRQSTDRPTVGRRRICHPSLPFLLPFLSSPPSLLIRCRSTRRLVARQSLHRMRPCMNGRGTSDPGDLNDLGIEKSVRNSVFVIESDDRLQRRQRRRRRRHRWKKGGGVVIIIYAVVIHVLCWRRRENHERRRRRSLPLGDRVVSLVHNSNINNPDGP